MATVETEGFAQLRKKIEALQTEDPAMKKALQKIIRTMLIGVRGNLMRDAKSGLQMDSDPRSAYKAIRTAVYRRIFGGQVNILQKRKAGKPGSYQKPLKGLPNKGGNRWGRSQRTIDLEGYQGTDRGFVLRFLNQGTTDRNIRSFTGKDGDRHDISRGGNRGRISSRNWFGDKSQRELENASKNLEMMIDELIQQEFRTM